ncbi:MAG: endonuclease/exonuclease/phosphatase family protein [Burkholderiales bacterium]|nr:endonuclease/exonuclease/phosphatase family protein [Burkholderiales bacterium]
MKDRAAPLLQAVAAGTVLAFGLGQLGALHWVLDLFAHWRVQYAAVLAGCGFGLLALQRPRSAALALLAAAPLAGSVMHYTGSPGPTAQAAPAVFRFATFNQSLGNPGARAIGARVERSGADAIALQEVASPAAVQALAAALPSYPYRHSGYGPRADVTIFSRWPLRDARSVELTPGGARAVQLRVDWAGRPLTLVGVHLHWPIGAENVRLRNAELEGLVALARGIDEPLLIGGDFNITAWSPVFAAALGDAPVRDCARGHGLVSSWPSFFPPAAIRIDHCLASPHWRVRRIAAGPGLGSDHRPMLNELELRR